MRNFRNQPRRKSGSQNAARDTEIARLYTEMPVTLKDLGDAYGITRERVRQVLKRQGITSDDAARSAMREARNEALEELRTARRDKLTERVYGCGLDKALTLNGGHPLREHGTRSHYYLQRRVNVARHEGWDQWQLTFPEWAALWAGKPLGSRHGPGSYVVHRIDKTKPWTIDNVTLMRRDECTARVVSAYYANLRSEPCSSR